MTKFTTASCIRTLLVSCAALSITACGSSGRYRIGAVGDVPGSTATSEAGGGSSGSDVASANGGGSDSGTGGTGGTGGSVGGSGSATGMASSQVPVAGRILVSAGNAVIGVAGQHNALAERVNGLVPGTERVTGTVTAVLRGTGQTLVDVGGGRSVVLNKAAGTLGDVVAIDLGSRKVVSASNGSALIGVGIASSTPATGTLASVNLGSGTTGAGLANGGLKNAVAPVVGTVVGAASGSTGGTATIIPVVQQVTNPVSGVLGAGLIAGGTTTVSTGNTSASTGGLLGTGVLIGGKHGK